MSENSVRKYGKAEQLPSETERANRTYRTRPDPLVDYWDEIEELLESNHRIKPYAILEWLKDRYNKPGQEEEVNDSIRRTLERRVAEWKLDKGVQKEVMFPQVHHPGDIMSFDFSCMNRLGVTINRQRFDHMFFHAALTYSNWETSSLVPFGIIRGIDYRITRCVSPGRRSASSRSGVTVSLPPSRTCPRTRSSPATTRTYFNTMERADTEST